MANWYSSGLPEDAAAAAWTHTHCQAALDVDVPFLVPQLSTPGEASSFNFGGYSSSFPSPWSMPIEGLMEGRAASTSRSHSEAEKRRRDRINAQLATLRKLIPKSEKMDKAALLGSVVDHVRDLKRKATEISEVIMIPTDVDEVTVDLYNDEDAISSSSRQQNKENIFLKASVCCDDRPELLSELNRALKSLRLTTVHADMISLGGRIRSIFILCFQANEEGGGVCMKTLRQSLKVVLSRIATSCSSTNCRIKSRRQRFFWPSH